jgi:hypothetical protein
MEFSVSSSSFTIGVGVSIKASLFISRDFSLVRLRYHLIIIPLPQRDSPFQKRTLLHSIPKSTLLYCSFFKFYKQFLIILNAIERYGTLY